MTCMFGDRRIMSVILLFCQIPWLKAVCETTYYSYYLLDLGYAYLMFVLYFELADKMIIKRNQIKKWQWQPQF